jgi:uncharacterized membrane protein YgcG
MGKTRVLKLLAVILTAAFALVFTPQAASAGVDDFEFESMHVEYSLALGEHNIPKLNVTETLVAVFPETDQNRGIRRLIPTDYQGRSLLTTVTSVVDEKGQTRDFTADSVDGFIEVVSKFEDDRYVYGRQTYVISYSQQWVVGDFGDTDEFYWDVNGTGWSQPFGSVSATVTVAPELSSILQTEGISCYTGAQDSTNICDSSELVSSAETTRVHFSAKNLAPGETLTINLTFDQGVINTGEISQVSGSVQYNLFWIFIALIVVILIWGLWYRITVLGGRRLRKFVTVQYEGPKAPELGVVGSVIGGRRWQSAMLVQAAVLGYLTIATDADNHWVLTRTEKLVVDGGQKLLIDRLFPDGRKVVTLGQFIDEIESRRIANIFADLSKQSDQQALAQGYYSHFAIKTAVKSWLSIVTAIIGLVWVSMLLDEVVGATFVPMALLIGIVASVLHFSLLLSKRMATQVGVDLTVYLEGLKEYIQFAEKDRLDFLQSPKGANRERGQLGQTEILKLYEEVLPWAVLLGLADQWAKVLTTYYDERHQPNWIPVATIGAINLSSLDSAIVQSLAVSAESGSSGGGSAGGGGGGGGGGGV